jgi:hypothetical protein
MRNVVLSLIVIAFSILSCASPQKAPEWKLRGWTVTPSPTGTHRPDPTPGPTIIYIYPTEEQYSATVRVPQLEIRGGPGTSYPGIPDVYLSKGDVITVMACKIDGSGEGWANFYWPARKMYGWAAVTYQGKIFLSPLPGRCSR